MHFVLRPFVPALVLFAPFTLAAAPAPSIACPITLKSGGVLQNDSLLVTLPPKFVFEPGGPGFVDSDGALGMKVGWSRKRKGQLEIGGRRLDGIAPPARAYIYNYGEKGFQPIYLVFPTPGCWKIVGRVGEGELEFVVEVEEVGDGPSSRFEGLRQNERISSLNVAPPPP